MSDKYVTADGFRAVMGHVPAPVSVITTIEDGQPYGLTVSAFNSLSLDPPMIILALDKQRSMLTKLQKTKRFGVNLLGVDQVETATLFGSRSENQFDKVDWEFSSDLPRLIGSAGWLTCTCVKVTEGGDHQVLFCNVVEAEISSETLLVHHNRAFCRTVPLDI